MRCEGDEMNAKEFRRGLRALDTSLPVMRRSGER